MLFATTLLTIPSNSSAQSVIDYGETIFNTFTLLSTGFTALEFLRGGNRQERLNKIQSTVSLLDGTVADLNKSISDSKEEIREMLLDLKDTVENQKEEVFYIDVSAKYKELQSYFEQANREGFDDFGSRLKGAYYDLSREIVGLANKSPAQSEFHINGVYLASANYILAQALLQLYFIDIKIDEVEKDYYLTAIDGVIASSKKLTEPDSPIRQRIKFYENKVSSPISDWLGQQEGLVLNGDNARNGFKTLNFCYNERPEFETYSLESATSRCPITYDESNATGNYLYNKSAWYINYDNAYYARKNCASEDMSKYPRAFTFFESHRFNWKRHSGEVYFSVREIGDYKFIDGISFEKPLHYEEKSVTGKDLYDYDDFENFDSSYYGEYRKGGECGRVESSEELDLTSFDIPEVYLEKVAKYARILTQNNEAINVSKDSLEMLNNMKSEIVSDPIEL